MTCIGEYESMSDLTLEGSSTIFHVPNFVINDPHFSKNFKEEPTIPEAIIEVGFFIKLFIDELL